jgi:ubiquinone/menaquinone biosynthesis C-methylase UbiE
MKCICCNSRIIESSLPFLSGFCLCRNCGLIFQSEADIMARAKNIVLHYHDKDPHEAVAVSKKAFFEYTLNYLGLKITLRDKKILDIGCGYGYFLKMALKKGWKPSGVEITENAVAAARLEFGSQNIFQGVLNEANLEDNHFDAITLWDVLVMVNNPYEELKECHRVLKKGGIIGIRVRNVAFQKFVHQLLLPFREIYRKLGVKNPTVFHPFCFSPRAIEHLAQKSGFTNIRIENSPLSSGDPYAYGISRMPIELAKIFIYLISKFMFKISSGRRIIGPSLLIWAEKP